MSSPTVAKTSDTISIDLLNDLKGGHLKTLLESGDSPLFAIAAELAQYAGQPVASRRRIESGETHDLRARQMENEHRNRFFAQAGGKLHGRHCRHQHQVCGRQEYRLKDTQNIVAGPAAGIAYVNIDLDFSIAASVSGSGTVSGHRDFGASQRVRRGYPSYCHAVSSSMELVDALKEAFSTLAFPLEPDCAQSMGAEDIGRVNFNGTLGFGLDVTYGLGTYKFSAPGVKSVQQALQNAGDKLKFPTADVQAGAKASFSYTHTDHFGAIVQKQDSGSARLYLVRSAADEFDGSVGVSVSVSVTSCSASVDQKTLAGAVNQVTGTGGDKAAALADQLQASLVGRTNKWLSGKKGDGPGCQPLQPNQPGAALRYQADLTKADLTKQSWQELAQGDVAAATRIGGLTLLPGSGVGSELKKSVQGRFALLQLLQRDRHEHLLPGLVHGNWARREHTVPLRYRKMNRIPRPRARW